MSLTAEVTPTSTELLDLGSGGGGSLESAMRRFGVSGVGVEWDTTKIEKGAERGLSLIGGSITRLSRDDFPAVKYINADNVLEHLDSVEVVGGVVANCCDIAGRMVHIRHPSFEDEEYLAALGLKQYWTDWPEAHTAHVKLHEFVSMAAASGVYQVQIRPVKRAFDSDDPTILPADAPPNQIRADKSKPTGAVYDVDAHGPKPFVSFDRPVYLAFDILLVTGAEAPIVRYSNDPETSAARPSFYWSDRPFDAVEPPARTRAAARS